MNKTLKTSACVQLVGGIRGGDRFRMSWDIHRPAPAHIVLRLHRDMDAVVYSFDRRALPDLLLYRHTTDATSFGRCRGGCGGPTS